MSNINTSPAGLLPGPVNLVPSRVAGYDLARAIALLGMVFVNFRYLLNIDDYRSLWLLRLADRLDGRPAVTLIVLAGIGMSLLKNSSLKTNSFHQSAKLYLTILKRAAFLILIGLMFSCVWHADILHFYGVYFTVAVLLINASNRILFMVIGAVLVSSTLLFTHFNIIPIPIIDSLWEQAYWTQEGILADLFVHGCYPVFPWIVYFLFGIWLGRQNLSQCRLQNKILLISVLAFLFSEAIVWSLENRLFTESTLDIEPLLILLLDTSPVSSSILSVFSASATALVVIVSSMKLTQKAGSSKWLTPFQATAQMSLTLYISHIGIIQLSLMISDRVDKKTPLEFAWIWASILCLFALVFSNYWVRHYGRGPLEKILRWVSK